MKAKCPKCSSDILIMFAATVSYKLELICPTEKEVEDSGGYDGCEFEDRPPDYIYKNEITEIDIDHNDVEEFLCSKCTKSWSSLNDLKEALKT